MAFDGRCVVVGFASGDIPKVPANLLLVKNCALVGLYWGAHAKARPHCPRVAGRISSRGPTGSCPARRPRAAAARGQRRRRSFSGPQVDRESRTNNGRQCYPTKSPSPKTARPARPPSPEPPADHERLARPVPRRGSFATARPLNRHRADPPTNRTRSEKCQRRSTRPPSSWYHKRAKQHTSKASWACSSASCKPETSGAPSQMITSAFPEHAFLCFVECRVT